MGDEQTGVFGLPLVAVGLDRTIFQVGFEVGCFVEEDPKEEVGIEVAVDRNLVKRMVGTWPAVVAEFRCPLAGDM